MNRTAPQITPDEAISATVYSAVWPETEALMRKCLAQETEAMLKRHRQAHTKVQDGMHEAFFDAWRAYAAPIVDVDPMQLPYHYPTAGSSEAIREIIRSAQWNRQDVVLFDGEYEGYEAMAAMQGTRIIRVDRARWRETLAQWRQGGSPWAIADRGAQWWVSQPSAIDGNVWPDFQEWLTATAQMKDGLSVWVDLCYVGVTTGAFSVCLNHDHVAGVVFSLSKTMGAYYRRIGGCFSREPLAGLWGNGWFKNLDSLYLGTRWLTDPLFQGEAWRATLAQRQRMAMEHALSEHRNAFLESSISWEPSDVALLMHAGEQPGGALSLSGTPARWWAAAARGTAPSSRRLCLTPSFEWSIL